LQYGTTTWYLKYVDVLGDKFAKLYLAMPSVPECSLQRQQLTRNPYLITLLTKLSISLEQGLPTTN